MAEHPNISLLKQLNAADLTASADLFAQDVTWHYYNQRLPDLQGDYIGLAELKTFFQALGSTTKGTFHVEAVAMTPIGDELVTMHTRNTMTIEGQIFTTDVVLVWRIVEGLIQEIWDIPSIYTKSQEL